MPSIRKLPEALISQIAAGEVIERPASCLKELLDNAIDSGASDIRVSIEGGGSRLIRVEDDGCGISKDDLPLAFERHATSKIASFEDLQSAMTLGFRGEALASAASVARAEIHTRPEGSPDAWKAVCDGGGPVSISPSPRLKGTSVDIRDLFYFVPARRKFLKSEATETSKCREAFISAALSRPGIAMSFSKDGKRLHRLPAQTLKERALALLGDSAFASPVDVDRAWGSHRIEGVLSPLDALPSGKDVQLLFVNGRRVRDRSVSHAIREAVAQSRKGRDAAYALFLTLPPELVDSNAHPAKIEVRFRDARSIHQLALQSVLEALGESSAALRPEASASVSFRRPGALSAPPRGWSGPAGSDSGADPFAQSPSLSSPRELQSGWVAIDLPSALWLLPPLEARLACMALRLAARAAEGLLEPVPLLAPPTAALDPEAIRLLRSYSRQLESIGLALSFLDGSATLRSAPLEFASADFQSALEGAALALRHGASAFRLCLALSRSLPEDLLASEPLSDALASADFSLIPGAVRVDPPSGP